MNRRAFLATVPITVVAAQELAHVEPAPAAPMSTLPPALLPKVKYSIMDTHTPCQFDGYLWFRDGAYWVKVPE
jgi:hypothetical protein